MIEKLKYEDGYYVDEEGISHENKNDYIHCLLGFCGCGNPDEVLVYVKNMLEKFNRENISWGDYEDLPYMFFVYWANDKGFLEHGSTARCSWITDKGKELLSDIELVLKEAKKNEQN